MKRFQHMLNSGRVKLAPSLAKAEEISTRAAQLDAVTVNVIRLSIKDDSVRIAFQEFADQERYTKRDVDKLIKATADGQGLAPTETKDLLKILSEHEDNFTQGAKDALQSFLSD